MFEEDGQWDAANGSADELHRKLFGEIKQGDMEVTQLEGGQGEGKKKRKRKREIKVIEVPVGGREHNGEPEEYGDIESSTQRSRKTPKVKGEEKSTSPKKKRKSESHQDPSPCSTEEDGVCEVCTNDMTPRRKREKSSKLFSKMSNQLEGSRFRMINQQLYTSSGAQAKELFDSDPELFDIYHRGFSMQVSKWPSTPLDHIIDYVKSLPKSFVISDFGCGEAKLAQSVPQRVHSFDLVAINDRVIACDMAHVPLEKHTVDICVFCLSLMGCNVSDFIQEARRVVKKGGEMVICEVLSRFSSVDGFVRDVEAFGFKLLKKMEFSKMFIELVFSAVKRDACRDLPQITLKPCIYKRR